MTCRPQTIAALALGVTLLVGCSAAVERPCSFWSPRVSSDAEAELAMARVAAHHCVEARDQVLGRLADPALRADALETLVALGRTPETEQAVVAALAWPETVARAASLVLRWRLRGAEVALAEAMARPGPTEVLVDAALTLAPASRWSAAWARRLRIAEPGEAAELSPLLRALATAPGADLASAADTLGAFALTDPGGPAAALLPGLPTPRPVLEAAEAGHVGALRLLATLDGPAALRAASLVALAHPAALGSAVAPILAESPDEGVALIGHVDPAGLASLALAAGPLGAEALAERLAVGGVSSRAEAARGLAAWAPPPTWQAVVAGDESRVVRDIAHDPTVAAWQALVARCAGSGQAGRCYLRVVEVASRELPLIADRLAQAALVRGSAEDAARVARAPEADRSHSPESLARSRQARRLAFEAAATAADRHRELLAERDTILLAARQLFPDTPAGATLSDSAICDAAAELATAAAAEATVEPNVELIRAWAEGLGRVRCGASRFDLQRAAWSGRTRPTPEPETLRWPYAMTSPVTSPATSSTSTPSASPASAPTGVGRSASSS